ncbi:hypothetical protein [Comamonas endophytica]|uniref:Uncharacterized protein n=1 Tax=Comamonas endophytica TaxID=2949090 RepID=A0ABY6G7L3_9BURK|nr:MULTISPECIES: hypothetical protein [unclassified Acidovorax]MCD2511498.1 hypothetical protein [Acidovorax sp. D4N7]UYG50886.1 hypothetical protein M9799_12395 [Acidovorax sp. 5MLIR]
MSDSRKLHLSRMLEEYKEELRKLEEERRSLLQGSGLNPENASALLADRISDEQIARIEANAAQRMRAIEQDVQYRMARHSNGNVSKNTARRIISRI